MAPQPNASKQKPSSAPQYLAATTKEAKGRQKLKECKIFQAQYSLQEMLGSGTFGVVFKCFERYGSKRICAVKVGLRHLEHTLREDNVLNSSHHANLLPLMKSILHQDPILNAILVVPFAPLGDLHRYVCPELYALGDAHHIFVQISQGLHYLHSQDMIHGDIKPGNILIFPNPDESTRRVIVRICDFGATVKVDRDGYTSQYENCTQYFAAPEVYGYHLQKNRKPILGKPADMWSLGAVLYFLLSGGSTAFMSCDSNRKVLTKQFEHNLRNGWYCWPDRLRHTWPCNAAKELVNLLFEIDINKRATIAEVLYHNWVLSIFSDRKIYLSQARNPTTMPERWKVGDPVIHPEPVRAGPVHDSLHTLQERRKPPAPTNNPIISPEPVRESFYAPRERRNALVPGHEAQDASRSWRIKDAPRANIPEFWDSQAVRTDISNMGDLPTLSLAHAEVNNVIDHLSARPASISGQPGFNKEKYRFPVGQVAMTLKRYNPETRLIELNTSTEGAAPSAAATRSYQPEVTGVHNLGPRAGTTSRFAEVDREVLAWREKVIAREAARGTVPIEKEGKHRRRKRKHAES